MSNALNVLSRSKLNFAENKSFQVKMFKTPHQAAVLFTVIP